MSFCHSVCIIESETLTGQLFAFNDTNSAVDGDLTESIQRSESDRPGKLVLSDRPGKLVVV